MTSVTPYNLNKKSVLLNGLHKKCPNCGVGPLFSRGIRMHDRCSHCQLKLLSNPGDPYALQAFFDRGLFVFPLIVFLFFGVHQFSFLLWLLLALILTSIMIITTPHRYGFCVAVDYLTRVHWADLKYPPRG